MNDFNCLKCNQTFIKGWSDEEAEKEFLDAPYYIQGDDRDVICDDCFDEFKEWFDKLTPEDHKRIRNE